MFPPMSSTHWLEIGFYSRFSLPPSMAKITLTRPTTTRRLSTWEVPLAKSAVSNLACEAPAEEIFKVDSSAALCVQETRDVLAVNPFHEAELENSEYPLADSDSECDAEFKDVFYAYEPEFDASLDDDVLQSWTMSRNILAIDSTTPWLTPHIVITPASDTMSDLAIAWFNQPNYYQDTSKLCLPPSDFAENPSSSRSDAPPIITSSLPLAFHPISVFSPSKFNAMIEGCSHERLSYFNVVIALRRQIMKAVAIMASQAANSFRERYDSALPFSNIDRPFSWTDPAEPILSASRFHRATLILDSTNPFRVPHIIINQPPPEDQWLTATNTVNDPQDYGFGRYLVVHSRGVNYVNEPEDAYLSFPSDEYYDTSRFDENEEEENGGWADPVTENEEDYDGIRSYNDTLECYTSFEELPELDTESLTSVESPFAETPDPLDDDADYRSAYERDLEKRMVSSVNISSVNSCAPLYMDGCPLDRSMVDALNVNDEDESSPYSWADEEDDLPPLEDEWYQSVIRRTQDVFADA
ncbi:uncharacterized protein C8R40DRAFT_1097149 [Lentinula edodes]|uniref:uncharacterized protein n=1 Tax=Lentinula edodes TaxID=5353 RepID=UPI001E8CB7D0|nr:uncharacterized protein C8R40DRAFT_1097149 [Lentinula edodes]KAH7877072.1 hypothetical protein C8R40DRAFT_1097149 [Lentinula edodes]